jgi:hypothetical protein
MANSEIETIGIPNFVPSSSGDSIAYVNALTYFPEESATTFENCLAVDFKSPPLYHEPFTTGKHSTMIKYAWRYACRNGRDTWVSHNSIIRRASRDILILALTIPLNSIGRPFRFPVIYRRTKLGPRSDGRRSWCAISVWSESIHDSIPDKGQ